MNNKSTDESLKETFESIIIALILAFVFRAYVVEAFVIPTGSMAPTLMGEHVHVTCQECGYSFNVDSQSRPKNVQHRNTDTFLICPMCHYPNPLAAGAITSGGDRILVHKYIYNITEPSRFDVVVFKEPAKPTENFIKRLVGLPGEQLWIIEGNIYVKKTGANTQWHIARKTDARQGYTTQRDLWQPVYHSQYVPLDHGKLSLERQLGSMNLTWQPPWTADHPDAWDIANKRSYTHLQPGTGRITFDFLKCLDPLQTTWYPYNQFHKNNNWLGEGPVIRVEDVRLSAIFEPKDHGLGVTLSTQARMNNPDPQASPDTLEGHIDAQGLAWLQTVSPSGQTTILTDKVNVGTFPRGQGTKVELWYVDQEATLWVNGRRILRKRFDPPMSIIINRPRLAHLPKPAIRVQGPAVVINDVEVDRDIHYTSSLVNDDQPGRGAMVKTEHGHRGEPVTLSKDQFFCMGDNSPLSSDGRFWSAVNPWIVKRMMTMDEQQTGVVPRKLMMGRAFFVYFPAMYPWNPKTVAFVPNFGKLRFIH